MKPRCLLLLLLLTVFKFETNAQSSESFHCAIEKVDQLTKLKQLGNTYSYKRIEVIEPLVNLETNEIEHFLVKVTRAVPNNFINENNGIDETSKYCSFYIISNPNNSPEVNQARFPREAYYLLKDEILFKEIEFKLNLIQVHTRKRTGESFLYIPGNGQSEIKFLDQLQPYEIDIIKGKADYTP
jgi:hypothetical protein